MVIGPVEHKINIRSKNFDDFENFIKAVDIDYDSAYAEGALYMQEFVEFISNNCYIPTSGNCFTICVIFFH